eukprot:1160387-Pelagomonas_calceolata.AAC.2
MLQLEALDLVERAFVHVDYARRDQPEHRTERLLQGLPVVAEEPLLPSPHQPPRYDQQCTRRSPQQAFVVSMPPCGSRGAAVALPSSTTQWAHECIGCQRICKYSFDRNNKN